MNKKNKIILGIVILLIVVGGSFYSGMIYGKSQAPKASSLAASFRSFSGTRTGASGTSLVSGSIISNNGSSITLQLPSTAGSTSTGSKIIFYSDATQISKTAIGTSADLTAGTTVSVTGTTNSDGSVTASSIQIRPVRPTSVSPGLPPAQ